MALSFAVNWVGVIVGNIALLIIGFVWFMPKVFARPARRYPSVG